MEISLTVSASAKPEAVALDHLLPDDDDDEGSDDGRAAPRALFGSDVPRARPRRTASVVVEE